jgi:phospholipid/cholesterol/gamma-HCH transport system permease protein
MKPMYFTAQYDPAAARLELSGDCQMEDLPVLVRRLDELRASPPKTLHLGLERAELRDIGPAWLLYRGLDELRARGVVVELDGSAPEHFAYFEELVARDAGDWPAPSAATLEQHLARGWRSLTNHARSVFESLVYGGRLIESAAVAWHSVKRLRIPSIVRHMHETGVQAIPVVAVIAMLISVISAYIGAQQLRPFGAEIFTVDLVAIGVLRELGVLLTAIMVAGRTGSAYAAELGVMKLNDEVDALESMGMNPYEVLVLPRVVALVLVMPLLAIVADGMGLLGGAFLTGYLLELPFAQFVARLDDAISSTTFWAGLVKAPVFGLLIALTGTLRGLQVRESSRELGRLTTVAVVQSIFLVIFADALFAVFFLEIDF